MRTKTKYAALIIAAVLTVPTFASARVVTLTVRATGGTPGVAELVVESFEVAEVLSFPVAMNVNSILEVVKDGKKSVMQTLSVPNQGFDPVVVAGPATIRLVVESNSSAGLCTIKITPEAYPPDKSILIAPGSGGAATTLECSTNLVNWMATTNGVYTNLPAAKFFRIREERIQGN